MITKMIAEMKFVADPDRRETSKTMFPNSMEYLGVRTPKFRVLLKEWWIEIKTWPPEKLIVKALSWALRELSKSDKPAVERFMDKYDLQIAPLAHREIYMKLETGRKNG